MAKIARIKPCKWTFVTCWNMLGLYQQNGCDKSRNLLTGSHVEEYYTHDNCSSIANKSVVKNQNHIKKSFDIVEESCIGVRTAIGDELIVAGSADGVLGVWDKVSYMQVFRSIGEKIVSVKIARDVILVVVNDRVDVMKYDKSRVELVATLREYGSGAIIQVDSDGDCVLLLLFNLQTFKCERVIISGHINSVLLYYPYCMAVGASCGGGVWDLTTGLIVKTFGDKKYWELHSNGRFLLGSEMNIRLRKFKRYDGPFPPLNVTLFDMKGTSKEIFRISIYLLVLDFTTIKVEEDVYASNINPDAVWHKHINLPTKFAIRGTEYCCSDVNMTAIVASQNDMIFVLDFANHYK